MLAQEAKTCIKHSKELLRRRTNIYYDRSRKKRWIRPKGWIDKGLERRRQR
jgi:hypothetical protein